MHPTAPAIHIGDARCLPLDDTEMSQLAAAKLASDKHAERVEATRRYVERVDRYLARTDVSRGNVVLQAWPGEQ